MPSVTPAHSTLHYSSPIIGQPNHLQASLFREILTPLYPYPPWPTMAYSGCLSYLG